MKYTKKETKQETEKFNLQEAFALWTTVSKGEKEYLTGKDLNGNKLIGFYNVPETEKEPVVRIYELGQDGKRGEEVITLWKNKSQKGNDYLSGTTNENEKIIAFFGDEHQEKRPIIKGYFK